MSSKYRALRPLEYPTSPAVLRKLKAGEHVPFDQRGHKRVAVGEVVDDVPAVSVGWLVEKGWIEPVAEPAPPEGSNDGEVR